MPASLRSFALPVLAAAGLTGSIVATGSVLNSGEACCPAGHSKEVKAVEPPVTEIASTDGVDGATWLANLEVAKERAAEGDKLIYMTVGGSDWCPPCMQMHENLYTKAPFQQWAKENVVLVDIDFPRRKAISDEQLAYNEYIAEFYQASSFPTILAIRPDGTVKAELDVAELLSQEVTVEDWLSPFAK